MITHLSISNFKCFAQKTSFDLGKINILTGLNGRGKSTVFQSLLMLSQSINRNGNIDKLFVNGKFISLDLFEDIINFEPNDNKTVKFEIHTDNKEINTIEMGYSEFTSRIGEIIELKVDGVDYFQKKASLSEKSDDLKNDKAFLYNYPSAEINDILKNFFYISANRLGPTRDESKEDEYDSNQVGVLGEHRLNILSESFTNNMISFDGKHECILKETNKWLNYIMDGATIEVIGEERASSVLQLTLSNNSRYNKKIKSINFGFGYSYILSIIITALIAKPNQVVFIENPEAHLHPRAQARLMELICKLSEIGVQVFVETHSEHIINCVRLCALKDTFSISNTDVSMYFFGEDFEITQLLIDDDGQIENWPIGFFDQQENDLALILKLGLFK